jgi:hypothetical protein
MNKIVSDLDLENCFKFNHCIVFIFNDWSAPSILSRKTVLDWEKLFLTLGKGVQIWEIVPDEYNFPLTLIKEEILKGRGYGSLIWIKLGKIIDFDVEVNKFKLEFLNNKLNTLFGL